MNQKLLLIGGSTAVGKSNFALTLSNFLNMEIISADSVQVYKELNVGTSKPTENEQEQCPHHLVNIRNFNDTFNAFDFVCEAKKAIENIASKGKLPVIVGGTGLYMEALLYAYSFENKKDSKQSEFDFKLVVLNKNREKLYEDINKRVDKMLENGLLEEVQTLLKKGLKPESQAIRAIGYKEVYSYLKGEMSFEECVEKIKQATRNYAKRQITWFKHMQADWIDVETDFDSAVANLVEYYKEYKKPIKSYPF